MISLDGKVNMLHKNSLLHIAPNNAIFHINMFIFDSGVLYCS